MRYIEAPNQFDRYTHDPVLFLAGGITDCPDWQKEVASCLEHADLVVLNPRRACKPEEINAAEQIQWEFKHLQLATGILFWFPKESVCPISLFEYGKWLGRDKRLFVGTHPEYVRRFDVVEQTRLERPLVPVVQTLNELITDVGAWTREQ